MSEQRSASVWEYMAVAYPSAREPRDAISWLQHPQSLCTPRALWREMRSPWWRRRPAWVRLGWIGAAGACAAGVLGLALLVANLLLTERIRRRGRHRLRAGDAGPGRGDRHTFHTPVRPPPVDWAA